MKRKYFERTWFNKAMLVGSLIGILLGWSGCISVKTDAFLLGAGIGAGGMAYLLKGGNIGGYSLRSLQGKSHDRDFSIPSDLEWEFIKEEF